MSSEKYRLLKSKFRDCEDDIVFLSESIFQNSNFQNFANMLRNFVDYLAVHSHVTQLFSKMKFTKSTTLSTKLMRNL